MFDKIPCNKPHNKAIKTDAADYAVATHGCAILCVATAPLLRSLSRRYGGIAMSKILPTLALCLAQNVAMANEMFYSPPTDYVISGGSADGEEPAYSITAKIGASDEGQFFKSLDVKIYDQTISVSEELLEQIVNPNLGGVRVINDAGIFGSYFYISIPFGERGKCREARRNDRHRELYISSGGTMDGKGLSASITDPCD